MKLVGGHVTCYSKRRYLVSAHLSKIDTCGGREYCNSLIHGPTLNKLCSRDGSQIRARARIDDRLSKSTGIKITFSG